MRVPYTGHAQFEEKAAALARVLGAGHDEALALLAHISGYADASSIETGADDKASRFSREELIARLQATRPDISDPKAAEIVDLLALPVRDTNMEHIPDSPHTVPNTGF
jgi:hypothetical protein